MEPGTTWNKRFRVWNWKYDGVVMFLAQLEWGFFFKYLMIFFEVEQAEGTEELQKIIKYGKLFDENHF